MGMYSTLIGLLAAYFVYNDAKGRGHDTVKAMLWAGGTLFMPIVAIPLYLLIGRKARVQDQGKKDDDVIDIEATVVEETINCSMCGSKVKEDLIVCPHCNHTLKPKCQSCGQEVSRELKVCPFCQQQTGIK